MATEVRLPQWGMGMQEGTLVRWLKNEGDPVEQGEDLAEIEAAKVVEVVTAPISGVLSRILVGEGQTAPVRTVLAMIGAPDEVAPEIAKPSSSAGEAKKPAIPQVAAPRVQVTPTARRLALDLGLDLSQVRGSGPGGRIVEADVRQASEVLAAPKEQVIPLTGIRGTIAHRMRNSLQQMAQVTLITEADVTELVKQRETLKQQFDLSYTDLVIKAISLALPAHPRLNAWIDHEAIRLQPAIHIGLAVALEDGLIVPVIRHTDRKSVSEIAQETQSLAQHARAGTLSPEAVTGSTFTVTNLGTYEIDAFTPIINPPEVAILGVGRIVERPARQADDLIWRRLMTLSLTFDHQAVDGAPAAAFLQAVKGWLEKPDWL
jgi:pyruvate dehydrogenase E2 component (dihydrolipoamide acetyltransferase)